MRDTLRAVVISWFVFSGSFADTPDKTDLEAALSAYQDSVAVGHKADSFLHAQRAYLIAKKLFAEKPAELAPISYTYATAAARYKEPIALQQFRHALELTAKAHGRNSALLSPILVDAAEEAIHRREPELAYAWLKKSGELLDQSSPASGFLQARRYMSLSRLYYNSGEFDRARKHADQALALASQHMHEATFPDTAQLYFWHGQVMRWLELYQVAKSSYTKALGIYMTHEPRARPVLSIHIHMVGISHELGNTDAAIFHCIEAQKYESARNMDMWYPIYDPAGRLSQNRKPAQKNRAKVGQILAGYTTSTNCRVNNIVVHKTAGINPEEAKQLLRNAYIAPRFRNGKLDPNQKVPQININVY